jgi:tRNA-dihydrouridine synthase
MLAPMAELSHRALRELIEGFFNQGGSLPPGSAFFSRRAAEKNAYATPLCGDTPQRPEYYSEMISAAGLLSGGPFEKWYLDGGPCPERLVYQLLGADENRLAAAAVLLDRRDCLGIDLNMGCAAPAITRTGAGVRLMEDIDKAGRIAATLRRTTAKRLSVKLRLGPKSARFMSEEKADLPGFEYLLRFCRRLEAEGVDLITLHPRAANEKFKRRARWEFVEALRKELTIPVAGNGDIASAEALAEKAGPVMIGRLAVKEPWVFAAVCGGTCGSPTNGLPAAVPAWPEPQPGGYPDLEATGLRFLELLSRYQPPEFHLSRARRFFRYYCDNFTWSEYLRNKINREQNLSDIGRVISEYCREHPEG